MKAQRQWAFARAAAERWPSLGELRSLQERVLKGTGATGGAMGANKWVYF